VSFDINSIRFLRKKMIEQISVRAAGIVLLAAVMLPLLSNNVLAASMAGEDRFGTKEIYPTKDGGEEWYVNMDDPSGDENFKNIEKVEFTEQKDGSWEAGGKEDMRLEAWSTADGWKNVEITAHFNIVEPRDDADSKPIIQLYARGGHHSTDEPCLGSAYKARLYMDGHTTFVKEVNHPAYTDETGEAQVIEPFSVGQWMGFKMVIYNVDNDKAVHMESWVDEGDIGKNWKLASVVEDHGGWSVNDANMHDFEESCGRPVDAIITNPGVLAAFRTDGGTVWDFKELSVREIVPPSQPVAVPHAISNLADRQSTSVD
jgi:hypothetical protein